MCPRCGGPLNTPLVTWRASCMACGHKPHPLPPEMEELHQHIARMDPAEARARIDAELEGTGVVFDPTHPSRRP